MIGRGRDLSARRDVIRLQVRSTRPCRLDHYLLESLAWKSRTRIQKLIRDGTIRVNGDVTKPGRRVQPGDEITLNLSSGTGRPEDYEERHLEILYEDPWLVAVNKPPGMLVHPVGRHVYDTLINYLHARYHDPREEDAASGSGPALVPRLCHRLDRDTTGLVIVGLDAWVHREVSYQFENRLVSKGYLALVRGRYPLDEERIDRPIGEGRCLRSALDHPVLKPSRTDVRVVRRYETHSLLYCRPLTGRQNQIRVHLAARGFPVAGDRQFGDDPPAPGFPDRHLLHSERLRVRHPRLKTWLELRAPPPADLTAVLRRLDATPSSEEARGSSPLPGDGSRSDSP